jgi:hypothetical protein
MDNPVLVSTAPTKHDLSPPNLSLIVLNTNSDSTEQDQIFKEFTGRKRPITAFLLALSIYILFIRAGNSFSRFSTDRELLYGQGSCFTGGGVTLQVEELLYGRV